MLLFFHKFILSVHFSITRSSSVCPHTPFTCRGEPFFVLNHSLYFFSTNINLFTDSYKFLPVHCFQDPHPLTNATCFHLQLFYHVHYQFRWARHFDIHLWQTTRRILVHHNPSNFIRNPTFILTSFVSVSSILIRRSAGYAPTNRFQFQIQATNCPIGSSL